MTDLNENHRRYLLTTFSHVDKLLSEFECIIDVFIPRLLFKPFINDVTPELRVKIEKQCDLIRQAMKRILEARGIVPPQPDRSVLNSIRTTLIFADMSIEELSPKCMRGFGSLSDETNHELDAIVGELRTLLKNLRAGLPD